MRDRTEVEMQGEQRKGSEKSKRNRSLLNLHQFAVGSGGDSKTQIKPCFSDATPLVWLRQYKHEVFDPSFLVYILPYSLRLRM